MLLARITHVTEERLVQSRRVELDEPRIVTTELKSMRRAGGHVQKIARVQGYMLLPRGHTHGSVQTEEGFRVFLVQVIWNALSFGSIRHQDGEFSSALAPIGEKREERIARHHALTFSGWDDIRLDTRGSDTALFTPRHG